MIKSLFKTSTTYLSGLIASKILSTGVVIFLARILAPAEFGDFVFFYTSVFVISAIAQVGLSLHYQRHAHEHSVSKLLWEIYNAQTLTLIVAVVCMSIFFTLSHTYTPYMLVIWILAFIFHTFAELSRGYYLSAKKPLKIALKPGIESLVLIIGLAFHGFSIHFEQIGLWIVLSFAIDMIILVPWKEFGGFVWFNFSSAIETIKKSSTYAFLIITSLVYARGDQIIIKYVLNSEALGYYGVAYRFLDTISIVPNALAHNLFPISSKQHAVSASNLKNITAMMTVIGTCVGVVIFMAATPIIHTLLGTHYSPAIVPLKIFAIVIVLFFINSPLSTVIQSSQHVKAFLPFGIGNTLLNIVLNILLVPHFGIVAAAYIMLASELLGSCINIYFVRKVYEIS